MLSRRSPAVQDRTALILFWGVCGAWSVVAQSILFRQTHVLAGGWEPVLSIILSAWLAGSAAGIAAGGLLPDGGRWPLSVSLAAAAGPLALLGIRLLPLGASLPPGEAAPFSLIPLAGLVAALPGAASGLLFSANCRRGTGERDLRAGWVYATEGAGAAVGGVLVLVGTLAGISDSTAIALASASLAAAALLTAGRRLAAALATVVGLSLTAVAPTVDSLTLPHLWRLPADARIAASTMTPYGWTIVSERAGQREVRHDGSLAAIDPAGPESAWSVHPLASAVEFPGAVLLAGGEGMIAELLRHPVTAVDLAPTDPGLTDSWRRASPAFAASLADPRVTVLHEDARRHLASDGRPYRMILAGLTPPLSLAGNRLQTEEFFRAASLRLTPDGIIALAIPFAGEVPSVAEALRAASVISALHAVFPAVDLMAGAGEILVTAGRATPAGVEIRYARLRLRGIESPSFRPEGLRILTNPVRSAAILQPVTEGPPAPANRDSTLTAGRAAFVEAVGRLSPSSPPMLLWIARHPLLAAAAGFALCLVAILPLGFPRPGGSAAVMIGAIGAFSLVAETVLIYLFQARHGLLFSLVGVLLAAFMVGLASGAAAGLHAPPRWRLAPAISPLALVGAGALILWLAPRGFGASLPATTLLIFAIGFFDGLAYPLCIRLAGEGSSLRLYASELSGAAVGNLAVAALVLPLAGPSAAIAVSAAFLAVVSLPLAFGRPPRR